MDKNKIQNQYMFYDAAFHVLCILISFTLLNNTYFWSSVAATSTLICSVAYCWCSAMFLIRVVDADIDASQWCLNALKIACRVLSFGTMLSVVLTLISYNYYVGFVDV